MENNEIKPIANFDNFLALDMRVGRINRIEKVEKKDKLYKLEVDFGHLGYKTVVSAIAHLISPEDLLYKRTLFIVNFEPRKIAGIESEAMILVTEQDGKLYFTANVNSPLGSKV